MCCVLLHFLKLWVVSEMRRLGHGLTGVTIVSDTFTALCPALKALKVPGFLWFLVACVTALQTGFLLLTSSVSQSIVDSKAKKNVSIYSSDYVLILEMDRL